MTLELGRTTREVAAGAAGGVEGKGGRQGRDQRGGCAQFCVLLRFKTGQIVPAPEASQSPEHTPALSHRHHRQHPH